ncbi:MAG: hypothetical protein H6684_16800 [Deltaproteobacteria bacterium]|nr:hypothetical protein [Deltaproteobacteria bacterium]
MRTTITIRDDLADRLKEREKESAFSRVEFINDAIEKALYELEWNEISKMRGKMDLIDALDIRKRDRNFAEKPSDS